ncbi:hypothetical protein [Microcoleus sp. FACHB-SPT15]|uniref:hypothetical protein n=1 Tax=Microcoleus sp. FACHB-SPT15 TaxID=2692830 RepID=UPI001A7EF755|nr:hypothetical protein [Microcoleus sp. FACHB-SPT15]
MRSLSSAESWIVRVLDSLSCFPCRGWVEMGVKRAIAPLTAQATNLKVGIQASRD